MGKSQDLYQEAKKIIPGGNQLLSKRPEIFLPEKWPSYYKKAKGVEIWDLDDKKYIDMCIMGIGACVLGYADSEMEEVIIDAVKNGCKSTLNSFEEVDLAKKLIELHPWAEMARFSKTGGEATTIAVRIARAHSKKDKIAFCGYHGWHDWYLASNLADGTSLDGQLLPGLNPLGVPKALSKTAMPFNYGKTSELKEIVDNNKGEIGVIIMEVSKIKPVNREFLKEVKEIAQQIGAVLIYDEVSSGFRANTGGIHLLHGTTPDLAVFGKALGNGHPISAIIGRKDVMQAAQETFISSTYWTERLGFVAGLETIRQYEKYNVADHITGIGEYIKEGWKKIYSKTNLDVEVLGMPSIPVMVIKEQKAMMIKTLISQEMLKRGYLASTIVFASKAHNKNMVEEYLKQLEDVIIQIASAKESSNLENMLEGPVCHSGFKRLN